MSTPSIHANPTGRLASRHPGVVKVGRAGWAAKGVVYVLAGALALTIVAKAFGWSNSSANNEASPNGAVKTVAHTGGGTWLLWLLAIGMVLYALWRLVSAALPGENDAKSIATRVGYVISAALYASLAFTAISLARSPATNADGNSKVTTFTARVMQHAAGRWLVGIVGLVVIAVGVYRIVKGLKNDVTEELDLSGMSHERIRWTRRLGAVGEVGRGVALALIGYFLLRAAMTFNANEATGLDGALRRIATHTWGMALVAIVALGFVAYGIFCLETFTHRRLESP